MTMMGLRLLIVIGVKADSRTARAKDHDGVKADSRTARVEDHDGVKAQGHHHHTHRLIIKVVKV